MHPSKVGVVLLGYAISGIVGFFFAFFAVEAGLSSIQLVAVYCLPCLACAVLGVARIKRGPGLRVWVREPKEIHPEMPRSLAALVGLFFLGAVVYLAVRVAMTGSPPKTIYLFLGLVFLSVIGSLGLGLVLIGIFGRRPEVAVDTDADTDTDPDQPL